MVLDDIFNDNYRSEVKRRHLIAKKEYFQQIKKTKVKNKVLKSGLQQAAAVLTSDGETVLMLPSQGHEVVQWYTYSMQVSKSKRMVRITDANQNKSKHVNKVSSENGTRSTKVCLTYTIYSMGTCESSFQSNVPFHLF